MPLDEWEFELRLNNPITPEQWDLLTDVDFDHTDRIWFHTKHDKDVTFVKERKGKWERHYSRPNVYADLFWHCSECGYKNDENYAPVYHHFCPNCGARMEG